MFQFPSNFSINFSSLFTPLQLSSIHFFFQTSLIHRPLTQWRAFYQIPDIFPTPTHDDLTLLRIFIVHKTHLKNFDGIFSNKFNTCSACVRSARECFRKWLIISIQRLEENFFANVSILLPMLVVNAKKFSCFLTSENFKWNARWKML